MSLNKIYCKRPVLILVFFCSFLSGFSANSYKKIERNLDLGYLDKAYHELFNFKLGNQTIVDPEFWILEAKVELELHKTTVYAYQKLVDKPLLKSANSAENALKFAGNRVELFQIWTPFLAELERVLYNEAGKNFNDKLYKQANEYYEPLISLFPKSEYYKYSGVAYFKEENFKKGEAKFLNALTYPNQDASVYQYTLECIKQSKPYNETRLDSVISTAIVAFPENKEFIKFKISILETKKTQDVNYELFPLYQKIVELDPNDKVMTYNFAVQLYNMAVSFYENENKPMTDEYAKKAESLIENYLKLQKDSDGIFESLKRKVKLLYLQ